MNVRNVIPISNLKKYLGIFLKYWNTIFLIKGSDEHQSTYNIDWVIDTWTGKKTQIEPYTCIGEELEKLPAKISYNDLTQKEGQKMLIKSILKYGVGIVKDVSIYFICTHILQVYDNNIEGFNEKSKKISRSQELICQ